MTLSVTIEQLLALIRLRRSIAARKWHDAYVAAAELDVPDKFPKTHMNPAPAPTEAA